MASRLECSLLAVMAAKSLGVEEVWGEGGEPDPRAHPRADRGDPDHAARAAVRRAHRPHAAQPRHRRLRAHRRGAARGLGAAAVPGSRASGSRPWSCSVATGCGSSGWCGRANGTTRAPVSPWPRATWCSCSGPAPRSARSPTGSEERARPAPRAPIPATPERSVRVPPPALLALLYSTLIFAGAGVLALPISATTDPLDFSEALFTATSAVTVTGLIVVDTATCAVRLRPGDGRGADPARRARPDDVRGVRAVLARAAHRAVPAGLPAGGPRPDLDRRAAAARRP